jgi:hypothetical protein
VSAISEPFQDGSNLSVIAINTSGQLVQFNRASGSWKPITIGSNNGLDDAAALTGPFTDTNGDLSVFAIQS